jgi:calpain-7
MRKAEWIKKLEKKQAERKAKDRALLEAPTAPVESNIKAETNRRPPVSTRKLTIREETLLLKSSKINGYVFVPWETPPAASEFISDGPFS